MVIQKKNKIANEPTVISRRHIASKLKLIHRFGSKTFERGMCETVMYVD